MRLLTAVALSLAAALLLVVAPASAVSPDPHAASPEQLAATLGGSQQEIVLARDEARRLGAQTEPAAALDAARYQLQRGDAEYRYRRAIRDEQVALYRLAGDTTLAAQVEARLPAAGRPPGLDDALAGLRAAWRASGITDLELVRPRQDQRWVVSEPVDVLSGYYQAAGAAFGVDWTYLAAINYIESDFGRTNGPSTAGALGPMQFLPSTWNEVGGGGDIMSPHDSIMAAARFLHRAGAPWDNRQAVFAYNHDANYVEAVQRLAAAMRADSLWLPRLYYWNTFG
jgi:membrane-bound lytic murein transglycosylase B